MPIFSQIEIAVELRTGNPVSIATIAMESFWTVAQDTMFQIVATEYANMESPLIEKNTLIMSW